MITDAQIRMIWSLANQHRMEEEDVRYIAQSVSGRPSVSGLTKAQACRVIDRLMGKKAQPAKDPNQATDKQLWKIRDLEKQLGWQDNPKRLLAFVQKYYKIDRIEWLTKLQARRLIDSLKNVLERDAKKKSEDQPVAL